MEWGPATSVPGTSATWKEGVTRTLPCEGRRGQEGRWDSGGASGARFPQVGVGIRGRSAGEKGRAGRVWKEDWTLARGAGERRVWRGWTADAWGRFERVTLGAGGGRAPAEFGWNRELRFGDGDLRAGGGAGEPNGLERGFAGKGVGVEAGHRPRVQTGLGSSPRWEGRERSRAASPPRRREPGLRPLTGGRERGGSGVRGAGVG